ncbi:MAG: TonB-dependent receptor [Pseudomonadota bacterium]
MIYIIKNSAKPALLVGLLAVFLMSAGHSEELKDSGQNEAQTETENIGETLVISATRGNISVFEAPHTVSVVQEEEIKQKQFRSLPEALIETPGVLVQKTSNGQGSPFIRGFTGYRTLALIDGVRYNNSVYRDGPNEYFSLIDLNTLEGLELLNGPASILYGSDAVGGTLNLKTKSSNYLFEQEGETFIHGSQLNRFSTAESSQLSRTELELGEGQSWGLHMGFSYKGFGDINAADLGRLPETGYTEIAYDARFDIELTDDWTMTYVHQSLKQDDVWRTHSTIFSKSFAGTTIGTDLRRLKDQQRSLDYIKLSGVNINQYVQLVKLTISHQGWHEEGDRIIANGERLFEDFKSNMFGLDLQLESFTTLGQFIYGIDFYQDNVDSSRIDLNADGSLDAVRIQGPVGDDSTFSIFGAYLQGRFPLTDRINITAGTRLSYTHADVGRFEDPDTGLAASFEDSWVSSVSSLRANYSLNEANTWKVWGGISQSFRAPNIADLTRFGASRSNETEIAATNLDPEKFLTFETGLKVSQSNLNFTGTYYITDINDFITSTPTGNIVGGLTEVSKQNSSEGFIQGIELTTEYLFGNGFQPYANVTWLEGELDVFDTTNINVRENFSRIMPLTSVVGLRWQNTNDSLRFDFSITHATKADKLSSADASDTQRIPPGGTPAYTLINARAGKKFGEHIDMNVAVNNLLDEAYRTHGSGSNEPGLGLIFGVNAYF